MKVFALFFLCLGSALALPGTEQKNEEDICNLPAEEGLCRGYFPMYYFDAESGTCKKMIYGGCGGNDNRFATAKECYERCSLIMNAEYQQTCEGKADRGMCLAYMPMYYYNADTNTCEKFIYGGCQGNGNRYATKDECERKCKVQKSSSNDICTLEPETGPCRALFHKYYYNHRTGECEKFIYGGCRGNGNRFDTIEECHRTCSVARLPEKNCEDEPKTGPCRGSFTRFFFNKKTGECEEFIYGGCEGNGNNYIIKESCEAECIGE